MNNIVLIKMKYATPIIRLYTVHLEHGFAMSLENPEYDPEQNW